MKELLPITVVICALNEESRIKDAILSARKNYPAEIIVIEGGSTDNTYGLACRYADKVYQVQPYNLGHKRSRGVIESSQPYILNMDADQVIEVGHLSLMLKELTDSGWVGIQAQLRSFNNHTYWERAMEEMLSLSHSSYGETTMIGTPALYMRDVLLQNNFNGKITGSCDDTDLCYRLIKKGFRLGISNAICYQKHRISLRQTFKKFYWYGQGDLQFAALHKERAISIFLHPLKNYMFLKTIRLIKKGAINYSIFPFIAGFFRHLGFWKGALGYILKKETDSRIESRNKSDY